MLHGILETSARNQVIVMTPFTLAGAMAPVTLAGALAAVVLALVLILPAGAPGGPTLGQAAALAGRGATAPAPGSDPHAPSTKLAQSIEALYFPNWQMTFHSPAVGQRSDRINGRLALTVYYAWQEHRIAYTIVGAPSLGVPGGTFLSMTDPPEWAAAEVAARKLEASLLEGDLAVEAGGGAVEEVVDRSAEAVGDHPQDADGRAALVQLDLVQEGPAEVGAGHLGEADPALPAELSDAVAEALVRVAAFTSTHTLHAAATCRRADRGCG